MPLSIALGDQRYSSFGAAPHRGMCLSYTRGINNYEAKVQIAGAGNWNLFRVRHSNTAKVPIVAIAFVYGCWTIDTSASPSIIEGNIGNSITIAAAAEIPNASDYSDQTVARLPMRFGGKLSTSISYLELAVTDPTWGDFGTGDIFGRHGVSVAGAGQYHPAGVGVLGGTSYFPVSNGEGRVTEQANNLRLYDNGGPITENEGQGNVYSPVAILGLRADGKITKSAMLWGDSIFRATDDYEYGLTQGGWGFRLMESLKRPYMRMTINGDTAARNSNPKLTYMRRQLMSYCSTVLSEFSINDITGGATLDQLKTYILAMAKMVMSMGKRFVQATPPLAASSTDAFLTLANQTPTSYPVRNQLIDWLNDSSVNGFKFQAQAQVAYLGDFAGPCDIINATLGVECDAQGVMVQKGGCWPPAPGGVLASGTLTGSGANTFADSTANWTPYAFRGKVILITGGTGAGSKSVIATHTANTGNLPVSWATAGGSQPAAGSTYKIIDSYTADGKHPVTLGAKTMESALRPYATQTLDLE